MEIIITISLLIFALWLSCTSIPDYSKNWEEKYRAEFIKELKKHG